MSNDIIIIIIIITAALLLLCTLWKAHNVTIKAELEALAATGCTALLTVLMNYLKRWVLRQRLKVSVGV